ncbi:MULTISPECIES: ferredoxin [unclassified Streptomyces]|uniref:ferredoxin n=1 Tax=unclassified Streptomyces TaxID=2593676 RepID=UPI000DBA3B8F|nr:MULTISPECIES: ferredoxin [Streptomyces]MYU08024.1 ferredoxin [Streptomyces sp. SID8366]MYU68075.1 ferredoxin [Streptomyces sp. SID69]TXJ76220.1 ferredoxin [Streptomyces lavendulae]
MTQQASPQQLYRFLEDRFSCAQACTECARACSVRVSLVDPGGPEGQERVRRLGIMCAEVCDATCRMLCEETRQDEEGLRGRVDWCRRICLEGARAFEMHPGAESAAAACRACADACVDFLDILA